MRPDAPPAPPGPQLAPRHPPPGRDAQAHVTFDAYGIARIRYGETRATHLIGKIEEGGSCVARATSASGPLTTAPRREFANGEPRGQAKHDPGQDIAGAPPTGLGRSSRSLCNTCRRFGAGSAGVSAPPPWRDQGARARRAHTKSVSLLRQFEQRNRRSTSGTSPRSASISACRSASAWWRQDLHHTSSAT
jgi:hypothetical protein